MPPLWTPLADLRVTTWNARALLTACPDLAERRWRYVEFLLQHTDALLVQETHGDEHALGLMANRRSQTHHYRYSPGPTSDAGGLVFFLARAAFRDVSDLVVLQPGRIAVAHCTLHSGGTVALANVHNYDIDALTIVALDELISAALKHDAKPWVLAGDWNFPESGSPTLQTRNTGCSVPAQRAVASRSWRRVLRKVIEVSHGCSTRFSSTRTRRGTTLVHSSLDRMYVWMPSTEFVQYRFVYDVMQPAIPGTPAAELSDHVPVKLSISQRGRIPPSRRPIQRWVFRHPLYRTFVTQRLLKIDATALHPADIWRRTKQAIRCAAAATRNAALSAHPKSALALAQRAIQLSRALHRRDASAIATLRRRLPDIRHAVQVAGRSVRVTNADALQRFVAEAIRKGSTLTDADEPTRPGRTPTHAHRRAQVAAWLRLWVPHMRRRWLADVVPTPSDADVTAGPTTDAATALADYWRTTFRPAASNRRLGALLAQSFVRSDPDDEWPLPTASAIGRAIRRTRPTAPGPDGIHYEGWANAGPGAWAAISSLGLHLAGGHPAPPSWSASRTVFLPKGESPTDRPELSERWRPPGDTRPITLKNSDTKLTAAVVGRPLGRILARRAPAAQRGFIPGRDACASVVLLDAAARALSHIPGPAERIFKIKNGFWPRF